MKAPFRFPPNFEVRFRLDPFRDVGGVIFDFVGTIIHISKTREELLDVQIRRLYDVLKVEYPPLPLEDFTQAFLGAAKKYREIREFELREVTNSVWVSEALRATDGAAHLEEEPINRAVRSYFEPYIESARLAPCAEELLGRVKGRFKVGLLSNFTYAPTVHAILNRLNLARFFDVVVVSHEVGFRKPHPKIFEEVLGRLRLPPSKGVFVGDDEYDDVVGAKDAGMKAILLKRREENGISPLNNRRRQNPDLTVSSLCTLLQLFNSHLDS